LQEKTETEIRTIVYNDELIIKELVKQPHTYSSLLGSMKDNGTLQQILRRRLKRMVRENDVWKLRVPGTRFGLALFCYPEANYKIITLQTLLHVRVFYLYEYTNTDKYLTLTHYWELDNNTKNVWHEKTKTLNISKIVARDGGFRIWE
jgi:hypothetical protein